MYAAVLVALVAILILANLSRRAKQEAVAKAVVESPQEALLLKFVTDETAQRRGETVALDGEFVILKMSDGFARLPAAQLKAEGDGLRLEGYLDWDAARKDGDAWKERSTKVITYREDELPKDDA